MQQRRVRLGDVLDDYCPRERRITNHVVVAMIEDTVKQTRCSTCDADHVYKHARVPARRKAERNTALSSVESGEGGLVKPAEASDPDLPLDLPMFDPEAEPPLEPVSVSPFEPGVPTTPVGASPDDDGPVHRRLIRATLPRPEGQAPERKEPEFTIRQPGGRGGREVNGNRVGYRPQGSNRRGRHGEAGGPPRFGGHRQGGAGPSRFGSGSDPGSGSRPGRHGQGGQGQGRGPRPGGQGRRRGR